MNTLIVVLSESVIWYEYGMHPRSTIPTNLEAARPGSGGRQGPGSATGSGPGPGMGSDDSGGDSDDPFITEGGGKGKNRDGH